MSRQQLSPSYLPITLSVMPGCMILMLAKPLMSLVIYSVTTTGFRSRPESGRPLINLA